MRNILPFPPISIAATVDVDRDIVLPTLEPVLSLVSLPKAAEVVLELIAKEDSIPQLEKLSLKHAPKSDDKTSSQIELERLETKLRTVQLALEVLTGVCATLPDPEPASPHGDAADGDDDESGDEEHSGEACLLSYTCSAASGAYTTYDHIIPSYRWPFTTPAHYVSAECNSRQRARMS